MQCELWASRMLHDSTTLQSPYEKVLFASFSFAFLVAGRGVAYTQDDIL